MLNDYKLVTFVVITDENIYYKWWARGMRGDQNVASELYDIDWQELGSRRKHSPQKDAIKVNDTTVLTFQTSLPG